MTPEDSTRLGGLFLGQRLVALFGRALNLSGEHFRGLTSS